MLINAQVALSPVHFAYPCNRHANRSLHVPMTGQSTINYSWSLLKVPWNLWMNFNWRLDHLPGGSNPVIGSGTGETPPCCAPRFVHVKTQNSTPAHKSMNGSSPALVGWHRVRSSYPWVNWIPPFLPFSRVIAITGGIAWQFAYSRLFLLVRVANFNFFGVASPAMPWIMTTYPCVMLEMAVILNPSLPKQVTMSD
jgi:hypothetical protein